ncbi:MAG: hypothetical protein EXS13_00350 [Planctomycetes bacterium]|nr:hypothetical protein [Planctomycetota bacterium]
MKVLALVESIADASVRLRLEPLLAPLARSGVEVRIEAIARSGPRRWRQLAGARAFDAVWWQRRLPQPWESGWLARCSRRLIVDLDDAVWRRDHAPFDSWSRSWRARTLLHRAQVVTVGAPTLAAELLELGVTAVVLPTPVVAAASGGGVRSKTPLLVWVGQPATWPYVAPFMTQWARVRDAVPGVRWRIVGAVNQVASGDGLEYEPWSAEAETRALAEAWIGLAPLPDDPWTRGKCGARLQSYLAAGIVALASPVGGQADLMREFGAAHPWTLGSDGVAEVCSLLRECSQTDPVSVAAGARLLAERSATRIAARWCAIVRQGAASVADRPVGR